MIEIFLFVISSTQATIANDARLAKPVSIRDEIISIGDLAKELTDKTGLTITSAARIKDRKITVIFKNRPSGEAMERIATCMFMVWNPTKNGYELDLTKEAAAREQRTEAFERERTKAGLREAVKEVRALWSLGSAGRDAEMERLDKEFGDRLKAGENKESPAMQLLGHKVSALHEIGVVEVLGPAFAAATLDSGGVPIGTRWFASADPRDGVGRMDIATFPHSPQTRPYSDGIGVVTYSEVDHELQTRLFLAREDDSGAIKTGAAPWTLAMSNADQKSELEIAMNAWSRPPSATFAGKAVEDPPVIPERSEYLSGMFGRARHQANLSERSGIPIVADASRRALTPPRYFRGKTVQEWLDAYAKASKVPYRGVPDAIREEKGWLLFRQDHWWWKDKSEIPESTLMPLEAKPPKLEDYARFVAGLTPGQLKGLEHPETSLLKFPTDSLTSCAFSLALFGLCNSTEREAAFGDGVDLATTSPRAQDLAYEALLEMGLREGDMTFLRSLLRKQKGILEGIRFFAERESDGVTFSFGSSRARPLQEQKFLGKDL